MKNQLVFLLHFNMRRNKIYGTHLAVMAERSTLAPFDPLLQSPSIKKTNIRLLLDPSMRVYAFCGPEVIISCLLTFLFAYDLDAVLLPDDKIFSYRPGGYGLFSNGACPYLVSPLIRPFFNDGKIAVLRFKAPFFPDTRGGGLISVPMIRSATGASASATGA